MQLSGKAAACLRSTLNEQDAGLSMVNRNEMEAHNATVSLLYGAQRLIWQSCTCQRAWRRVSGSRRRKLRPPVQRIALMPMHPECMLCVPMAHHQALN